MSNMVATLLPHIAKGAVSLIASRIIPTFEPEDPTLEFLGRELELFDRYQERMEAPKVVPLTPVAAPAQLEFRTPAAQQDAPCPFCQMEEKAGYIKNHLEFVAMECSLDGLGPATGGMIPKAQAELAEVEALAQRIQETGGRAAPLAELVLGLSNELKPKLDWVGSCEEAQAAAKLGEGLWLLSAKAAQVNFAQPARRG